MWCWIGDFNAVCGVEEKRGRRGIHIEENVEVREFNSFLDSLKCIELPLVGKHFTWFSPWGDAVSRLDRCFVSVQWLNKWPNQAQYVLNMSLSYHCPLMINNGVQNWGPQLFRVMNGWFSQKQFLFLLASFLQNFQVQG